MRRGTFVGIIPGVGEDVGSWSSYAAAKKLSKNPEEFGKGSQEGLIAAETGDNAVVSAAMIPTLTLALPGSAAAAVREIGRASCRERVSIDV